jgi:hypothetical protein
MIYIKILYIVDYHKYLGSLFLVFYFRSSLFFSQGCFRAWDTVILFYWSHSIFLIKSLAYGETEFQTIPSRQNEQSTVDFDISYINGLSKGN